MAVLGAYLFCILFSSSFAVNSVRFFVIGDVGGIPYEPYSTYIERSTAQEMGKIGDIYKPDFIMELGDNFYDDGVDSVYDKRFQETFESVFTSSSLQVPWYFVAGNHDHRGNVSAQIEYSKFSKRWNFPNYYYYIESKIGDGKTLGIVLIDTVLLCGNTHDKLVEQPKGPANVEKANEQWKFIDSTLRKSKADFLFVAGHFPIYSIAEHGPTDCLVDRLLPMIDKYNVNGYLCGHDHNLQHLQTKSSVGNNIDYFVSGMANIIDTSTAHRHSVPEGSSIFHYSHLFSKGGFLYAEATTRNVTFTFLNAYGQKLHTATAIPRKNN